MDHSITKHQGELSLLEMMQNMNSPGGSDGRKTPEAASAPVIIALNEEKNRRLVSL